ncbi:hypothetical protein FIU89_05455 [Roseovarius sp. THAF27]|uniref:HNH endonuclease n=1 Tax=unclassified Roseovarius TaxID=2614913 RepID=UPI001268D18C|nr:MULTISPECIES: HNH endonuclease [unclassified Roseovarius]QFT80053.1 hypothetical protein FIU89_05455 [Roseovarius sp. THAF27]QFT96848.1 hypothetical protein FIU85_06020 [Roseovarius sp. THAF8]
MLRYEDDSEVWFREVIDDQIEEARKRAFSIIENAVKQEDGCFVTNTERPQKIRFHGRTIDAYRFICCVLTGEVASRDRVVRHRCHNRRCVNPDHLRIGSQRDNKHDDWEHWAYGTDPDFL